MAWNDPAHDRDYIDRTRKIVRDLSPWVGRGIYVNMLNFDEMDRVIEAFGGPESTPGSAGSKRSTTRRTCSR